MIRKFKDKNTEAVFKGEFVKGVDGKIQQRAREKLKYLDSAGNLRDLMIPPSNQLEPLKGDRKGQYSIRINKQWRVCFNWKDGDAFDAEIADYH
ncbi:MAG: plasmid maintenance system killer protein [Gammaproteobacteria bacterium RIFCSPLOWO2_02_FULL_61_13]|nr:MAG: plasmid maintenance system killer protein [Gammaproteobacteria bacterium RIFCSPLOWO2_02_FULL_61_13]